jgi:hypothetical protein
VAHAGERELECGGAGEGDGPGGDWRARAVVVGRSYQPWMLATVLFS